MHVISSVSWCAPPAPAHRSALRPAPKAGLQAQVEAESHIFRGVRVYINGDTEPPKHVVRRAPVSQLQHCSSHRSWRSSC